MSVTEAVKTTKYLTFQLDDSLFALDISTVREVINSITVTPIPKMPACMCGVIDLRGGAVSVVDLRLLFEMSGAESIEDSCIIIIETFLDGETIVLGALVDSVHEVVEFEEGKIELPPRIGDKLDTQFIRGMGRCDGEFIIILDIQKIFSANTLVSVRKTGSRSPSEEQENDEESL